MPRTAQILCTITEPDDLADPDGEITLNMRCLDESQAGWAIQGLTAAFETIIREPSSVSGASIDGRTVIGTGA